MNKTTKQEGFFPMEHTGKRALVLAGGGAKGSYQIGVWRALQELDWTPDIITGASVGTLNGCLFTMGKIQEAEDLWRSLEIHDVLEVPATLKPEELRIMWRLRRVLGTLDQQQGLELFLYKMKVTQSNAEFLMLIQKTTPSE